MSIARDFVIVRHGNTFAPGEPSRRIGARTDLPLTPEGEAQATRLGAHLAARGWRFARALVSPLARTRATAAAILAAQPQPAPPSELCDWLREIDHGPDEDRPEDAVRVRVGAAALAAWETHGEPPLGWLVDPQARIAAWRALFAQDARGPVLAVTSNGAARFALLADPALAAAAPATGLKLPTGGYGVVARDGDGRLALAAWGVRP